MESGEQTLDTEQTREHISVRISAIIEELLHDNAVAQEARYLAVSEECDRLQRTVEELRRQLEAALITVPAVVAEQQSPQQLLLDGEAGAPEAAVPDEPISLSSAVAPEMGESASSSELSPLPEDAARGAIEEAQADEDISAAADAYLRRKNANLRQHNEELRIDLQSLRAELDELKLTQSKVASSRERLAQFEVFERERDAVSQELDKARQELAAQEDELKHAISDRDKWQQNLKLEQERTRSHRGEIRKLQESLKLAESAVARNVAEVAHLNETLVSVRAELVQAKQDLSICQSAREVLRLENAKLEQSSRRARDEYNWEVARRLSPMLANLSALAGLEPNETQGLSPRSVFEEFRRWVAQIAGGHLEPFPAKSELSGDLLWLDADAVGLESLMERYDWAGERPFEGLPAGQRKRAFRLSRRGWAVNHRVVARSFVTAVPDEQPRPDGAGDAGGQE